MSTKFPLSFFVKLACFTALGSLHRSLPARDELSLPTPQHPTTPESSAGTPAPRDPLATRRTQLLTRINPLTDRDCDSLIYRLKLNIPGDKTLNPKKELLRYVRDTASIDELNAIERTIELEDGKFVTLTGAVSIPGKVRWRLGMKLTEALKWAGPFISYPKFVDLIRDNERYRFKLRDADKGDAFNPPLQPGDIIEAPE